MDWRKNRIAIGAVVFVALLGLTLWATGRRDQPSSEVVNLPAIELEEETITSLEVTRPQGDTVVLTKADDGWVLTAPLEAEADQSNVNSALNRLADLELVRVVATQPENYERLEVDDANAVEVVVKADDQTLTTLTIGKYADGMTMLLVDDRPEVFGASGSLRYAFARELKAWRNRKVVEVTPDQVQSIAFESPNGLFAFERTDKGWVATKGAKKLGEFDPKRVAGLVSTGARLIATDFAPDDVSPARAGLTDTTAKVTLVVADQDAPIVLELGADADDSGQAYLRRADDETIYIVSQYLADRLRPDASAFELVPTPTPADAPPVMPQPGGQGQPQLPPEVMRQIQEQIRAQQQQQP